MLRREFGQKQRNIKTGASGWCGLELVNAGRWGVPAPAGRLNSRGLGNWPVVPAADGIALKCSLALEAGLFVER